MTPRDRDSSFASVAESLVSLFDAAEHPDFARALAIVGTILTAVGWWITLAQLPFFVAEPRDANLWTISFRVATNFIAPAMLVYAGWHAWLAQFAPPVVNSGLLTDDAGRSASARQRRILLSSVAAGLMNGVAQFVMF